MKKLIKMFCLLLCMLDFFTLNIFAVDRCVVSVIFSSSLESYQGVIQGKEGVTNKNQSVVFSHLEVKF